MQVNVATSWARKTIQCWKLQNTNVSTVFTVNLLLPHLEYIGSKVILHVTISDDNTFERQVQKLKKCEANQSALFTHITKNHASHFAFLPVRVKMNQSVEG